MAALGACLDAAEASIVMSAASTAVEALDDLAHEIGVAGRVDDA